MTSYPGHTHYVVGSDVVKRVQACSDDSPLVLPLAQYPSFLQSPETSSLVLFPCSYRSSVDAKWKHFDQSLEKWIPNIGVTLRFIVLRNNTPTAVAAFSIFNSSTLQTSRFFPRGHEANSAGRRLVVLELSELSIVCCIVVCLTMSLLANDPDRVALAS